MCSLTARDGTHVAVANQDVIRPQVRLTFRNSTHAHDVVHCVQCAHVGAGTDVLGT